MDARPPAMSGAGGVAENRVRHPVPVAPLVGGGEHAVVRQAGQRRGERLHHPGRNREGVAVIGRRHDQRAVEVDGLDRGADRPIELPGLDERPERVAGPVRVVDAPRLDHQEVRPAGRREDLDGLDRHVDDARLIARAVPAVELVLHVARREEPDRAVARSQRLESVPVPDVGVTLRLQLDPQVPAVRPPAGRPPRRSPPPARSGAARRRRRRRDRRRAGRCTLLRRARAAPRRRSRGPGRSRGRRPPPAWRR